MKFGLSLPNFGRDASKKNISRLTLTAEEFGFDSIWLSDHIVIPASHRGFGYNFYEPLVTLSYLSSMTNNIKLGTSVLIIPYRNPIVLAKLISDIDILSDGRLILGIGTGWMRDEFNALGAEYENRYVLTEEYIKIMIELWSDEMMERRDENSNLRGFSIKPTALQKSHPPIWIGGNSRNAIERALRIGNGWHAVGLTPAELNELIPIIKEKMSSTKHKNKDRGDFIISLRRNVQITDDKNIELNHKETLRGTVNKITDGLNKYKESGVGYMVVQFLAGSFEEIIINLNIFCKNIIKQLD